MYYINAIESNKALEKLTILDAMIVPAQSVSDKIIVNCFKKVGISEVRQCNTVVAA